MDFDCLVEGVACKACARLNYNGFRRMCRSRNLAAYDDVRGADLASHISCLTHDNRSVDISVARHVAKDVALNTQNTCESYITFNAHTNADPGIGATLRITRAVVLSGQRIRHMFASQKAS